MAGQGWQRREERGNVLLCVVVCSVNIKWKREIRDDRGIHRHTPLMKEEEDDSNVAN